MVHNHTGSSRKTSVSIYGISLRDVSDWCLYKHKFLPFQSFKPHNWFSGAIFHATKGANKACMWDPYMQLVKFAAVTSLGTNAPRDSARDKPFFPGHLTRSHAQCNWAVIFHYYIILFFSSTDTQRSKTSQKHLRGLQLMNYTGFGLLLLSNGLISCLPLTKFRPWSNAHGLHGTSTVKNAGELWWWTIIIYYACMLAFYRKRKIRPSTLVQATDFLKLQGK